MQKRSFEETFVKKKKKLDDLKTVKYEDEEDHFNYLKGHESGNTGRRHF